MKKNDKIIYLDCFKNLNLQEIITTCENIYASCIREEAFYLLSNGCKEKRSFIFLGLKDDFFNFRDDQEPRLRQYKEAVLVKLKTKFNDLEDFDDEFIQDMEEDISTILKILDDNLISYVERQIKNFYETDDLEEVQNNE